MLSTENRIKTIDGMFFCPSYETVEHKESTTRTWEKHLSRNTLICPPVTGRVTQYWLTQLLPNLFRKNPVINILDVKKSCVSVIGII